MDHNLEIVIFVADSVMVSKENHKLLEKHNRTYIIATRLKNLGQGMKEIVLTMTNYKSFGKEGENS